MPPLVAADEPPALVAAPLGHGGQARLRAPHPHEGGPARRRHRNIRVVRGPRRPLHWHPSAEGRGRLRGGAQAPRAAGHTRPARHSRRPPRPQGAHEVHLPDPRGGRRVEARLQARRLLRPRAAAVAVPPADHPVDRRLHQRLQHDRRRGRPRGRHRDNLRDVHGVHRPDRRPARLRGRHGDTRRRAGRLPALQLAPREGLHGRTSSPSRASW